MYVVNNLMSGGIQHPAGRLRLQPSDQQLRQTQVVQTDCVREWPTIAFHELDGPSVVLHDPAQHVEVLLAGAVWVIAFPAHIHPFPMVAPSIHLPTDIDCVQPVRARMTLLVRRW